MLCYVVFSLIEGVRKWMGSQPAPVHENTKAAARSRAPDQPRETERIDPTDTRVMATRHLAPFVSEEEEGEYQRSGTAQHTTPLPLFLFIK